MKLRENEIRIISDQAINRFLELSSHSKYQSNGRLAQTYSIVKATIDYLTSKKLLTEDIDVDDNMNKNYEKQ